MWGFRCISRGGDSPTRERTKTRVEYLFGRGWVGSSPQLFFCLWQFAWLHYLCCSWLKFLTLESFFTDGRRGRIAHARGSLLKLLDMEAVEPLRVLGNIHAREVGHPWQRRELLVGATCASRSRGVEGETCGSFGVFSSSCDDTCFRKSTSGLPYYYEESTLEQLSMLLHRVVARRGAAPRGLRNTGPSGHRVAKKNRLQGKSGVYDPSNCRDWEQCYRVWRSGTLMLGPTLDAYCQMVHKCHALYFQAVSLLLHQADASAWLEQLERVCRRGLAAGTTGLPQEKCPPTVI